MNATIIGTGYVGLVTGACLADLGLNIMCMDIDSDKIGRMKQGILPIYEPDLQTIVDRNLGRRLIFTDSMKEAVDFSDIIFIAVNTPTLENGMSDLSHVFAAASQIALYMENYKVVVNKSTVPIFTGRRVEEEIRKVLGSRGKEIEFDVVSNPEFLQEGSAVRNFLVPERIVIGCDSPRARECMRAVYSLQIDQGIPLISTNIETSEMIKYACNAFLATKISFINEMANICERCGADILTVAKAMGLDERIGPSFLQPGPGYGGSCLPKDTKALVGTGKKLRYVPKIVQTVIEVNHRQKKLAFQKIKRLLARHGGKVVTVLGLAFKPDTDDIRESPSLDIIKFLLGDNKLIRVFDPKAMDNVKRGYPELPVQYCTDTYSACSGADCIVLAAEWDEFKHLDFIKIKSLVNTAVLVDLKNIYDPGFIKDMGFIYEGVGRK